jgi:hypothetical protein
MSKRPDRPPGYNPSKTHLVTPVCKLMLACDGSNLIAERIESGHCGKCAKALAKKNKPAPPLKGLKVVR